MTYCTSVGVLAAALSSEAHAFKQRNEAAAAPEDFFLAITERALEVVPDDVLIAIVGGKMRGKLERAGYDMDRILPLEAAGGAEPQAMESARIYRLRAQG